MSRQGRSRKGGQAENPVSLFPFLSVLICTMGMLILLLVVINRSARTQAAEHSGINTGEIVAELDIEAQTLAMFANDLQKSKELTIADIEDKRVRLASLESVIETTVREIKQAEAALENLKNNRNTGHTETDKLAEALAAKREYLRRAELELQELQANAANHKNTYAIIPYRGLNGTDRRPLYIECRKDCVVIQPEGIVLREDDFLTASHPDNPLDAMLRAAGLFYLENELAPQGTKPYPLILVRPGGIDAYYAVRESIKSWDEQFGYELVEDDWTLEFPVPNEALKQRLEDQLAASRERMIPYKMMLMQQYAAANRLNGDIMGSRAPGLPGSATPGHGMPGNNMPGNGMTQGNTMPGGQPGYEGMGTGTGPGTGFENVDWQEVMATVGNANGGSNGGSFGGSPMFGNASGQANKQNVEYRVGPNGNMVRYVDGVQSEARVATGSREQVAGSSNNQSRDGYGAVSPGQPLVDTRGSDSATTPDQPLGDTRGSNFATVMQPGQMYSEIMPNWATPSRTQDATEVTRPILVECRPDKIIIKRASGAGVDREMNIPPGSSVYHLTNTLVSHLSDYIDTWGMSARGTFWQPEMIVTVQPGSETRFEELKSVLQNSGVRIVRR